MQDGRDTRCHFCNAPIKAGDEARDCNRMTVQITAETREEAEANALLIRSAPELLAAPIDLLSGAEAMGWDTTKAVAAIAKAIGGAA